jgi:hypothetical protein
MADKYKELVDAEWEAIESVLAAAHLVAGALPDDDSITSANGNGILTMRVLRATLAKCRTTKGTLDAFHETEDRKARHR